MFPFRVLVVVLWYLRNVASSPTYADDWSDWIIIPARTANRDYTNNSKNISSFDVRQVDEVNTYVDPSQMNTFILRTVSRKDEGWKLQQQKLYGVDESRKSTSDVVVPIGRTLEKVRDFCEHVKDFFQEIYNFHSGNEARDSDDSNRKLKKVKKKYRKFLFPLLVAYKLKFLALIPLLVGGLVLLVGTTGLAGFFFALFTAVMSLKTDNKYEIKKW